MPPAAFLSSSLVAMRRTNVGKMPIHVQSHPHAHISMCAYAYMYMHKHVHVCTQHTYMYMHKRKKLWDAYRDGNAKKHSSNVQARQGTLACNN